MTMLEIFEARLPENLVLISAKEKSGKYELVLELDGRELRTFLTKTSAPGEAENVADFAICAAMMQGYLKIGNLDGAKTWLEKQNEVIRLK